MATFVISDLHLDEDDGTRLFRDERQGAVLARLCEELGSQPDAELILDGDTFDLTSMLPPERGLETFCDALDLPLEVRPARPLAALLEALREANPQALGALARLSRQIPVTFVTGNHDRLLLEPGGLAALERIGLGAARIAPHVELQVGRHRVRLEHGHRFDPGNAERDAGGEAMTRCLHQAVIPFLRHHGSRRNVRMNPDRVVALRPEESVVPVLQRWLEPDDFRRFFRAFLRLLAANGYVPRAMAPLARFITPEQVRRRVDDADDLWERAGRDALEVLAGDKALPDDGPRPDILVMGHTHVIDWAVQDSRDLPEQLYVNLGTWTERAADASGPPDMTLPLLRLDDDAGRARVVLSDLESGRELQRFVAPDERRAEDEQRV